MRLIVCVDENGGIGKDGDLLFHLKEDMKKFKQLTENQIVVMGRKTLESLPHKKLFNRLNVVLTHQDIQSDDPDIMYIHDIEEISKIQEKNESKEVYCIGGESLYRLCLPYCNGMHITLVHSIIEDADTFFPDYNEVLKPLMKTFFNEKREGKTYHDEKTNLDYDMIDIFITPQ